MARKSRKHRFLNLYHLLNRVNLETCFYELKKKAATGIDNVTWQAYEANLEENLRNLNARLRTGSYHARPIRRKYIPKGNGKQRPLGILCLEDKILQRAVAHILEAIYEQDFLDFSYGYRPKRSSQGASTELAQVLQFGPYGWVVEADIRGFFDAMDHDWLIRKWLKAGILEPDLTMLHPETGTQQGGIVFKWLNRRSQRKSYNWEGFRQAIRHYGLEEEKIEKIAA